ncbi:damage-inducible protein CinA [Sphingomonas sp. Leaf231]|uniref:CinA family protein n=1 Tax=Sphingomonas sp. Leaf231 TaxID=1736301 RepID=UPI0006F94E66|nr:CinA family protein [Sphingomonas sp. Leaf231]KQN94128.1 damage-inducible protein CinA [Sphingomonas sp. Leaf231]
MGTPPARGDRIVTEPLQGIPPAVIDAARRVLEAACARELSIVTAESCTGGLLASLLTDVEGASHAFERGFVVYSAKAKCELLGVAAERIDRCGAVSEDVARAMAEGALLHSDGDVALAITGFAGAGAPGDEPGLVHLACRRRSDERVWHRECHFGDIGRGPVREAALEVALDMLETALAGA